MRKILSFLLAVVLVATLSFSAEMMVSAEDPMKIIVSSAEAAPGETVDVTVSVKDNSGIDSVKVMVNFDEDALDLTEVNLVKDANQSLDLPGDNGTVEGFGLVSPEPYSGSVIINWFNSSDEKVTDDFNLAVLSFKVDENVEIDREIALNLDVNPADIYYFDETNLSEVEVPFGTEDGAITVADPEYSITYSGGSNEANPASYRYTSDDIVLKDPDTAKTGYAFGGWYSGNEKVTKIAKGSKGDVVLSAKWNPITYTVAFSGNGSTSGSTKALTATYDKAVALTANGFAKKGYSFTGWNTKADGKGTKYANKASIKNLTATAGGKVTLYAQWSKVTYTITYKLNGGKNAKNPASYTVTSADITLKTPTRAGYKFGGWYSDAKFKTKVTKITKGSTGNKTLYAKWTVITYKITYKLNSGKNNAKNPKSYKVTTSTITLKNPTRAKYTFKGWYSDSKFKKKVTKIAKGSTGNKTLYAKWAKK